MQFRLGGELGRMVEDEARVRGMSGPMLIKTIVGDWIRDSYKKRMKKGKKPQNQSLGVLGGTVEERPPDKASQTQEE